MTGTSNKPDLSQTLQARLKGIAVVAGIGNRLRGDDGAGPRFVEILRESLDKISPPVPSLYLLDCGEVPENYIGTIARIHPDTVVVVDSASMGLRPGEVRIVEASDIRERKFSTHGMSPTLFMSHLKQETQADVFMVAVQPATTTLAEAVSPAVDQALVELARLLVGFSRQARR